jgi:ubiquinone/menaquinone biosynthesis C-methylase UbiE
MNDLKKTIPKMKVVGLESSQYAINHSLKSVRKNIKKISSYSKLNFKTNSFDFVIALGVVYEQDLTGAIALLKEIQRVSKGKSFVTLGSYKTLKEFIQLRQWTLLGTIILKESEWKQVLKHVKYTGDYDLVNAKNLSLVSKK